MAGSCFIRPVLRAMLSALLLGLACLVLSGPTVAADTLTPPEVLENEAGARDTNGWNRGFVWQP